MRKGNAMKKKAAAIIFLLHILGFAAFFVYRNYLS